MMWIQAQAADPTGLNLATILGVGGPASIATLILAYLGKLWLDARKSKREDRAVDRESESGIVETTSALTKILREQLMDMAKELGELRAENRQLREDFALAKAEHSMEISKMQERITGLEIDNEQLRRNREAR